jgi:hypothetical protein
VLLSNDKMERGGGRGYRVCCNALKVKNWIVLAHCTFMALLSSRNRGGMDGISTMEDRLGRQKNNAAQ